MDFTIVTPSRGQLDFLGCCIASIADQEGVSVEHVVQDAETEGFEELSRAMRRKWPDRPNYRRIMISEPDRGMYDAINRGLKMGTGKICAYLNCDEQYLPGALGQVKDTLMKNPAAEILHGGFLVVDSRGNLVTLQRPVKLFRPHVATCHLPNFSCATFFLRSLLLREQAYFDPSYRACADAIWNLERLQAGSTSLRLNRFLSAFRQTGENRGLTTEGLRERERIRCSQPGWMRAGVPLWKAVHRIRKFWARGYFPQRVQYRLWQHAADPCRTEFGPNWSHGIWRARLSY